MKYSRATIPKIDRWQNDIGESVATQCELNCLVDEKVSVTPEILFPKMHRMSQCESQIVP